MRRPDSRRPFFFIVSLLCGLFIIVSSSAAFAMKARPRSPAPEAQAAQVEPAAEQEESPVADVTMAQEILDRGQRYSKKWQSEIGIYGGDYLGDEWLNTWDAGARYYLHLNRTFAIGANYTYSRIRAGSESSFGRSLNTKNQHIVDAELLIANDCALRAGKTIIHCELFMTLGGGATQINDQWKWLALIGGGIKIFFPPPWVALRFDVNSPIHPTPKPGGDSINADVMFNLGVSFFFPTRRIEPPGEHRKN